MIEPDSRDAQQNVGPGWLSSSADCLKQLGQILGGPEAPPEENSQMALAPLPSLHRANLNGSRSAPSLQLDPLPEVRRSSGTGPAPPKSDSSPVSRVGQPGGRQDAARRSPNKVLLPPMADVPSYVQSEDLRLTPSGSKMVFSPSNASAGELQLLHAALQASEENVQRLSEELGAMKNEKAHHMSEQVTVQKEEIEKLLDQTKSQQEELVALRDSTATAECVEELRSQVKSQQAELVALKKQSRAAAKGDTHASEGTMQLRVQIKQLEKELDALRKSGHVPGSGEAQESGSDSKASAENATLKGELIEKNFALTRLQKSLDYAMDDSETFVKELSHSSASPLLDQRFDLDAAEVLGSGNYGFVLTGKSKETGKCVVLKLMSERWARVAIKEWAAGVQAGKHPNVVEHFSAMLHADESLRIKMLLEDAFKSGSLTGKRPKIFPTRYLVLAVEFMDRGTVQGFMDRSLLTAEGTAAVAHQVALALHFMHKKLLTHNDVKPDNILLCAGPEPGLLIAKLADLGLASHSKDRTHDFDHYGYTLWCMGLSEKFVHCPNADERAAALSTWNSASVPSDKRSAQLWGVLATTMEGVWAQTIDMADLAENAQLREARIRINHECNTTAHELRKDAKRVTVARHDAADLAAQLAQLQHGHEETET